MIGNRRNVLVALAAASFLALLEIFRTGMTRIFEGSPETFFDLIHWVIPLWVSIVIASPWCAFMAWRFPVRAGRVPATLAAHLGGAVVFVTLHLFVLIGFHHMIALSHAIPIGRHAPHIYVFYVGMEASVYAAIVVVVMLIEARREASERTVAAARLERSLAAARLDSLQAQIRPHFLFNTLNALAVLARRGDSAAVDRAIGDLGELLRASFDSPGRHEVPLRDELGFTERYLGLQRIRFPDRLQVEWQVADEARDALVPVLLLQPLVENAIEHGLSTTQGGRVRVRAERREGTLELEVTDDGPGFAAAPAAPNSARDGGVGLANSRDRLRLLYGDAASLECGDRPGGGGSVRIRIPWRTAAGAPAPGAAP
jgi:two-component system LytT family sensor kinase